MLIATEAVLKQVSETVNAKKYGVSTPVTGSVVIKLIKPKINMRLNYVPFTERCLKCILGFFLFFGGGGVLLKE